MALRALDVWRDLEPLAELLERAFGERMDASGQRMLWHLRRAAADPRFLRWVSQQGEVEGLPLSGYVWQEGERLVGNVSLVPFRRGRERLYLVANVAVHPAFRRHGVARALLRKALEHAQRRRVREVWLQVEADNVGALALYRSEGFVLSVCAPLAP